MSNFLDNIIGIPTITRMVLPSDHPDARYDADRDMWFESDHAFRKRIQEALKWPPFCQHPCSIGINYFTQGEIK